MSLSSGHFQIYSNVSELHRIITVGGGILCVAVVRDINLDKLGTINKVYMC